MSEVVRRGRAGDCRPWEAPHVGRQARRDGPSPAELAELRRKAHDEGYEAGLALGREEGLQAARDSVDERIGRIESILRALQKPLEAADETVGARLADLAISIARRLVRRELRTSRDEVIGVVREALAVLPVGLRDIRLHLHPEDASLVSEMLVPAKGDAAWQIVEDPVITRGGCRISSPTSQVDATLETRLGRVINTMLGGERNEDLQ